MRAEGKTLRLTLPFYPKRIISVLRKVQVVNGPKIKILQSLEEEWSPRMADTYLSYCEYWGLINIGLDLCELTHLGAVILQLHKVGNRNLVEAIIYYAFVSSKEFSTFRIIARRIFDHLEKYGPFEFTNEDIPSRFVPEFRGRQDISDLTSVFWKAGILKREIRNGKIVYFVEYFSPTLESFVLSLLHYIKSRNLIPPHTIREFDEFRSFWFISINQFVNYLRKSRARSWISYQEFADINQFHFNVTNLEELTNHIIHEKVE